MAWSLRGQLRDVARRLDGIEDGGRRRLHAGLGAADARPTRAFTWLGRAASGTDAAVFVPVLLGAGVILSALAYLLERAAGVVGHATVDRATAARLAELEPPAGLLAPRTPRGTRTAPRPSWRATVPTVCAVAAATLVVGATIDALGDATQSRPGPSSVGARTTVELVVEKKGTPRPAVESAQALFVACQGTLPARTEVATIGGATEGRVTMIVEPGLGELARRRFFGCLQDATVDLVRAEVVDWR